MNPIHHAVKQAMDDFARAGELNIDRMRESLLILVEDAIIDWQAEHVEATTDEEQNLPFPR